MFDAILNFLAVVNVTFFAGYVHNKNMNIANLLSLRLAAQYLSSDQSDTISGTVRHLGAVQSQDFSGALWAVGMRTKKTKAVDVAAAFASGDILRTHVMRPTWHFVAAEDIVWLLDLTRERVLQSLSYQLRKFQLDDALLRRTDALIAQEVAGGSYRTRKELATILADNDVNVDDMVRLSHIIFHAELAGYICSGPLRGKQQTYALISERAPHAIRLERAEALAELARRYFKSHGPATIRDFAWWSGLTKQDAKNGLMAIASELTSIDVGGEVYWLDKDLHERPSQKALLLPNYDEYIVA